MKRSVVVDADVASSASRTGADKALSAVAALDAIEGASDIDVVLDQALGLEWTNHNSRLSSTWLKEMTSRKRVSMVTLNASTASDVSTALQRWLAESDPGAYAARTKDAHLFVIATD